MKNSSAKTILVIDDIPTNLDVLSNVLSKAGYKILLKKDGENGLKLALKKKPDIILLDIMMPGMDGYDTCIQLKKHTETQEIPIIFMSALSETIDKVKGFKVGAVDYITKPFQTEEVLVRIKTHLTLRETQQKIAKQNKLLQQEIEQRKKTEALLIQSRALLDSVLASSLDGIITFQSLRNAQKEIVDFKWIVVNPVVTNALGLSKEDLLQTPLFKIYPALKAKEEKLFQAFLSVIETGKPFKTEIYCNYNNIKGWYHLVAVKLEDGFSIIFRDITEIKQMSLELEKQAKQDGLTGILNRRAFDLHLLKKWNHCLNEKLPIALIMCDVDYFKIYNDTYGHLRGDDCLIQVAQKIASVVHRPDDLVARYGGEEFGIILFNTDIAGAKYVANSLREKIKQLKIIHETSKVAPHITASLGVASFIPTQQQQPEDLISLADQALYQAKEKGRDRIVLFEEIN